MILESLLTFALIALISVTSIMAFNNRELFDKLKFNAYLIINRKEYHRFFSHGLVHADLTHLLINMFVLYSFGSIVEMVFKEIFDASGNLLYLLMFGSALAFSSIYDFIKHKEDIYYNAVGASGAVAAVVFSSILLFPRGEIGLFLIPIGIPAPIFGLLYLIYSAYMSKRGQDNIGHNAHFYGAIYGVFFTIAIKPAIFLYFIDQVF
jgi:membrane associated rhomboid family serine protease